MTQRIYRFAHETGADGDASMAWLLGGKGANLAEMANLGIPVPPGFTITTDCCKHFETATDQVAYLNELMHEVGKEAERLQKAFGYMPLLSVRSGAPVSMPGMMDTILNVGLTPATFPQWSNKIGNRAAKDSYRRLIQMLGSTAYGIDMAKFDFQLASVKKHFGVKEDTDLNEDHLAAVIERYLDVFDQNVGAPFPDTLHEQLTAAVGAVFHSWQNPRAIEYRKIHGIDPSMGTAVTVQAMVFGNMGWSSGTGVLFSRDPSTGENNVMGEFLPNAQGEDVVAGIRTPLPLLDMTAMPQADYAEAWDVCHAELMEVTSRLELHYRDMMDLEFTVQEGNLWLLQCRVGKRSAIAAFRIAADLYEAGWLAGSEALKRVSLAQYRLVRRPRIPATWGLPPHAVGKPASPGVATGIAVFSAGAAVNCTEPCILITHETCPDDIAGMHKAAGILTATGGATSHAAVVARGMDKTCVVGCSELEFSGGGCLQVGPGSSVTICGDTGRVWFGVDVPVEDSSADPSVALLTGLAVAAQGLTRKVDWPSVKLPELQVVCLSDFWRDGAKLQDLLRFIDKFGMADRVILDCTPPVARRPKADAALDLCCGTLAAPTWPQWAVERLVAMDHPAGMALVGLAATLPHAKEALPQNGYVIVKQASMVSDLLTGTPVTVSSDFVTNIVGGSGAMADLMAALHAAGKGKKVMAQAVPVEYAAYSCLGS